MVTNMVDIETQTKEFERKLEEAEEDGMDPLSVWCGHIEWLETNKLTRHDCYKKALQQCVQYFSWSNMSVYKGEVRLAMVYLKMAKICKDPVAIYQHMFDEKIGTYCALFYDTYAAALSERGKVDEAVKLVKQGLSQNAQPMKKLQKRLESLKQLSEKQSAPVVTFAPTKSTNQATLSAWQDEKSERNKDFYSKSGIKFHYAKELVYPRGGGEVSLEHIKSQLPQYCPSFPLDVAEGECDMEMTMAVGGNITMHIPVVPDFFKPGAKQLLQKSSKIPPNAVNMEDKENVRESKIPRTSKPEEKERKPLQSIEHLSALQEEGQQQDSTYSELQPPSSAYNEQQGSSYDELEQLCAENEQEILQKSRERPNPLSVIGGRQQDGRREEDAESEFEREIEQLMIERDQAPPPAPPPTQMLDPPHPQDLPHPPVGEMSVVHRENLSYLKNQENQPREEVKASGFDFTPSSMEGGLHWPMVGQKSGFINTKLNFSEADSTFGGEEGFGGNSSRHHLSSSFGRSAFNSTLDLERRAKVTDEQLKFESEFANTEVDTNRAWKRPGQAPPTSCQLQTSSVMEPSFSDSQSFEVFHDSWAHHSRNTSRGDISRGNISRGAISRGNISRGDISRGDAGRNISGIQGKKGGSFLGAAPPTSKNVLGERRALQELPNPRSYPPPSDLSVDHTSYAASQSTMSSFSVFEDESCADQSSFAPFHDSWSTAPPPPGGFPGKNVSGQQQHPMMGKEYHAPLEAPVMIHDRREERENRAMEQSFTQFDIRHPSDFESVSTPMGARSALAWDVSAIPDGGLTELEVFRPSKDTHSHPPPSSSSAHSQATQDREKHQYFTEDKLVDRGHKDVLRASKNGAGESGLHVQHGVEALPQVAQENGNIQAGCPFNLSTITEESASYKSSSSGSRLTISSASSNSHSGLSSGTPHSQLYQQHPLEDVNPFERHIVNMMLNTLGLPVGKMEKISRNFPRVENGQSLEVGGERYSDVRMLVEGDFAKVYIGDRHGQLESIKVQSPAVEWELTIVEELHSRLNSKALQMWTSCFLEVKKAYRYSDAAVLISSYFPQGSLVDLVNAYHSGRIPMSEPVVLYYSCEILSVVSALHQCGVIHTNINPSSFMLRDIRSFTSDKQFNIPAVRGKGVCLVDFDRAVDTHVFPDDAMFVGSPGVDTPKCPAMMEGQTWKWQVDYFGIAATIHTLIYGKDMQLRQDDATGLHKPKTKMSWRYDAGLWSKLFDVLLNSSEALPLSELVVPLEEKLKEQKSRMLRQHLSTSCDTAANFMKAKLK